ncbi:hypothetical protein SAMN05216464_102707 [Mucilaginibacter pineti]|uniref:Uncharacterized protein n=1 Tax=Mucilaginibacter pineti TaxID=1391627 RepID=A0A1G6XY92_9SPHI|nr:hypothetical protein SAMN05216464_102707 [Mucilaginibacter pineti]
MDGGGELGFLGWICKPEKHTPPPHAVARLLPTGVGKTEFYKKIVISIEPRREKARREREIFCGIQSSNAWRIRFLARTSHRNDNIFVFPTPVGSCRVTTINRPPACELHNQNNHGGGTPRNNRHSAGAERLR